MAVEGWQSSRLGEVVEIKRGLSWSADQEVSSEHPDAYPVLSIPNIQDKLEINELRYISGIDKSRAHDYLAQKGWALMVGSNGNPKRVGNCVYIDKDGQYLFASFLLGLKPTSEKHICSEYMYRVLRSEPIQQAITDSVQGSTGLKNISVKMLREQIVDIPPLDEQKKIAEILGSVDEAIAKTEAAIAQTQKVKQGLLQTLLTKGIGHTKFKQTEIGEIPEGWDVVSLLDCVDIPNGQVDPKKDQYKSLPLVAPNHIESNTGRLLAVETAEEQRAISGKFLFDAGDVIYSKIRPYLRKVTLAKFTGLCSADMYPMRVRGKLLSAYLLEILLSQHFTNFANSVSMRTGIPKINRDELRGYRFALPKIEEQQKIVKIIDEQDSVILVCQKQLSNLRGIKSGLMSDLLTGRVRVKLDKKSEKAA